MAARPSRSSLLTALALAAVLGLALWVHLHALSAVEWKDDELGYRNAGIAYLAGDFTLNTEHPFLAKYVFGAAQSVVGGAGPYAVRLVSALAGVLTTLLVFALARRAGGAPVGLLAALLWVALPHPVQLGVRDDSIAPKVERIALLDPLMVLLLTGALLMAVRWLDSGRWRDALGYGALLGLAGGAKASAIYAVPAVVLVALVVAHRRGTVGRAVRQGLAAAALAAVLFLLSYAPDLASVGAHLDSVRETAQQQRAQGHAVIVADTRYDTSPWWSLAYWQWAGQGTLVTVGLVAASATALLRPRLPRTLIALLLLSILVPFLLLSAGNGFLLSHYAAIYQAPLAVLAALVVVDLFRGRAVERVLGAALGLLLVVGGAAVTLPYVAGLEPTRLAVLEQVEVPVGASIAVQGNPFAVSGYFPDAAVTGAPEPMTPYDVVIVDTAAAASPAVAGIVDRGDWREVRVLGDVRVYLR